MSILVQITSFAVPERKKACPGLVSSRSVKDDASRFLQENIMTIYLNQNMKVHFSFFGVFRALSLTRTATYVEQTKKVLKNVENVGLNEEDISIFGNSNFGCSI